MKKVYFPIINIIIAEIMIFFSMIYYGFGLHMLNLFIIMYLIVRESEINIRYVLQSLILVILLRIIGVSIPQFFNTDLLRYPLIYGVMFLPIFYVIKSQQISNAELGITFRKIYLYLPLAIIIGTIIGTIEYKILNPVPLIKMSLSNIILLSIIMFVFIGTVEEIIFRSILQTRLEKIFSPNQGVLLSGIMFGITHSGYGIIGEIVFAIVIGITLGYIFVKTRNIVFMIAVHGIANIILFGILQMVRI